MLPFLALVHAQEKTIADIQGTGSASPYANQTVSTRGAVTGVYKDGYFIRDGAGIRSGIYIYDPGRNPMPVLGDTVLLTGLVTEYYEWTEIKSLTAFNIVSTDNPIPEPVVLEAAEVNEDWESCLIKVENVICSNTDLGYGEWEVEDASGTLVVNDLGVAYSPVKDQEYTITGPVSYSFGAFKIEPRNLDDIEILAPVYFTQVPRASNIDAGEITITWGTNVPASSGLIWGYSASLEMGRIDSDLNTESHELSIGGLAPATLIYVQAFSGFDIDTATYKIQAFITASESRGHISVAFNRTQTDPTFTEQPELFTTALADTFINYIGKAQSTLDMALYDFTGHAAASADYNSGIAEAIQDAVDRGVKVRLITDAAVSGTAPGGTEETFPRLDVAHDGIMHHKFIVVDHESVENSWVVTGSTNPNYNNMVLDFNNLVAIQDQSLAIAYLMEFNEIWGSETSVPDASIGRSGSQKQDDTPHQFNINGTAVELYFSPSDQTTDQIAKVLTGSSASIDFAVMAFTENLLGDAIVTAFNSPVDIQGIIDYVEYSGSEFDYLEGKGISVLDYKNPDGSAWPDGATLHHKFAVVDNATDKACVVTGSHNWTASAESINDENTLIIYNQEVAQKFTDEFERIYAWLNNPPVMPVANADVFNVSTTDPTTFDILENDSIEGLFSLEILDQPIAGQVSVNNDFSVEYTSDNQSDDVFSYRIWLNAYPVFSDTATVQIHWTSGIHTYPDHDCNLLKVYPNPVGNGHVRIIYDGNQLIKTIRIFTPEGKMVYAEDVVSAGTELGTGDLKAGLYFLEVRLDDGNALRKPLIVE